MKRIFVLCSLLIVLSGCAVFAKTEIAPYKVLKSAEENKIELRHYDSLILVSTSIAGANRNGAFRKLFNYISGENVVNREIPMTAPVFMDDNRAEKGKEIPMTAPVFMDAMQENAPMMSFVMPSEYTMETTPLPKDKDVKVSELKEYKVASIIFNGRLSEANIAKHKAVLEKWMADNGYEAGGSYKTAGYNAPFTLPALRRNEVLIPVK